MDTCFVLYEDWQMQCCGKRFGIKQTVTWPVLKFDARYIADWWYLPFLSLSLGEITYLHEAHKKYCQDFLLIEGVVEKIYAIYAAREPHPTEPKANIRIPKLAVPADYADGWHKDINGLELNAYFIALNDYTIRPALPADLTPYQGIYFDNE